MASFNVQGAVIITDVNGQIDTIPLGLAVSYTVSESRLFSVSASTSVQLFDGTTSPVTTIAGLLILPTAALRLAIGVREGNADAIWNSIPLAAGQPYVQFADATTSAYANGAATVAADVLTSVTLHTVTSIWVRNASGTATTCQIFVCGA